MARVAEALSRSIGSGAAGFTAKSFVSEIPNQAARFCTPEVMENIQSLLSGEIFTEEQALKVKTEFLDCTTMLTSQEAWRDFGIGTAGSLLVIIESVLNKKKRKMGKWGAAWEGFKAACVQATPYVLDTYLHLSHARQIVPEFHNSVMDQAIQYGGLAIATVGIAQTGVSAFRVGRFLVNTVRNRQAGIDAKREDRKAQTQELKTALERAVATGELPADPALAEKVTVLIENTDARRQVKLDSRQQAIKDRKERDNLRERKEQEKAIPVPQPAFSLDEAVGRVNFSLQEWKFYMKQLLKFNKSPIDPPSLLPPFLEEQQKPH